MAIIFIVFILLISIVIICYNSYKSIYAWTDHYGWKEDSTPDKNAKIQNITSEKVQYGSSSTYAKLKTKITFSDGFYFITHKTDYEHLGAITYRVYLSDELKEKIISSAIEKHNLSVDKFINNKQSLNYAVHPVDAKAKKDMTQIKIEIVNDEKYINLKKDDRIKYLENMKKKTTSELNKLNDELKKGNNKLQDIPVDIAKYIKSSDTSSLKNNILKLENKIQVIDELIALELIDKVHKKEYEKLTQKVTAKTQANKAEKVSIGDKENTEEENNDWEYWD